MTRREELNDLFKTFTSNVYFQPPPSLKMKYPAIKYERIKFDKSHADDMTYIAINGYKVTVMDFDPESEVSDKVSKMQHCEFDTHYTADGLNHDVYTLYY